MSQFYPIPMGAVAGLTVGLILRDTTGLSELAVSVVAAVVGTLAMAAWLASSLPNGSMVVAGDDDRAQLHTGDMIRWLFTAAIVGTVLVIVINEAMSAQPTLAPGEVEQFCGLCHVDWRRQLTALGIITGLVLAANWLLGGPKWPPEDDDE